MLKKNIMIYLIILMLLVNGLKLIALGDSPFKNQFGFQDPATPVMSGIIFLHDYIWGYLIFILIFVIYLLVRILILFLEDSKKEVNLVVQQTSLEIFWTLTPAFILSLIAGNSISHLYSAEELLNPSLDVIVIGSQWYWTYEFMVFTKKVSIESHMVSGDDLLFGTLRLLEVDNPLVLPVETGIRLLVTSTDVIHSWAVPSLGIKIDAAPGRINEVSLYVQRTGIFRGQCSEICGRGHGSMPIVVEVVSKEDYNIYLHLINYRNKKNS